MPTQQERSDTTREALLAVCRKLLLARGHEATTMAAVLAEAGLSKGALYHHFASKTELIAAIYRAESHGAITRALARAGTAASPLGELTATCAAWLEEVRDPAVAAILFRIGPAALGIETAQRIENEHSLALFKSLLTRAREAGEVGPVDLALAARLINAVMAELALSRLRNGRDHGPDVRAMIRGLLKGMESGA